MAEYNNDRPSVSTNAVNLFSDSMMFTIAMLNDRTNFKFTPAVINSEGRRKFSGEEARRGVVDCIMDAKQISTLYNGIMKHILPAIADNRDADVAIYVNEMQKDKVFQIIVKEGKIYALCHSNLTGTPTISVFEFPIGTAIINYSQENPTNYTTDVIQSGFFIFAKFLEGYILEGISKVPGHAVKVSSYGVIERIRKMAESMNISIESEYPPYGGGSASQEIPSTTIPTPTPSAPVGITEANSLQDFLGM